MNKTLMQALCVEGTVVCMLSTVPHHWVELEGGAVVFFAKEGKAHFLAYPMVVLPEGKQKAFWEAVGRLQQVREIETGYFTDNPVTEEDFTQYWKKEVTR